MSSTSYILLELPENLKVSSRNDQTKIKELLENLEGMQFNLPSPCASFSTSVLTRPYSVQVISDGS